MNFRLVPIGSDDGGLEVVANHNQRRPAEGLVHARVTVQPVLELLAPGRFGVDVTASAEHADENLRRRLGPVP